MSPPPASPPPKSPPTNTNPTTTAEDRQPSHTPKPVPTINDTGMPNERGALHLVSTTLALSQQLTGEP